MQKNKPRTTPDKKSDMEFLEETVGKEKPVVKRLAIHIDKVWAQNQKDFKPVRKEMIDTFRRVKGEYTEAKKAMIKAFGGSDSYFRSCENKARAAESWIKDIYRGDGKPSWSITPTEIPDLPDETLAQIQASTKEQSEVILQQLQIAGIEVNTSEVGKMVNDYYQERLDTAHEDLKKEAKERCARAEALIRDQSQEGGWAEAFENFLYYFVRTKFGIIKGPILTKKKRQKWMPVLDEAGNPTPSFEFTAVEELGNEVYSVSPFNFYPSKGMTNVNDGDCIEIHELSLQAIYDLIGVPGYDEEEVRAVITRYEKGEIKGKWFTVDDETAVNHVTQDKSKHPDSTPATQLSITPLDNLILAQEFSGAVSGALLMEWGIEQELDKQRQYQANCWKIGPHVIKAVINPDDLGRKPYHISSWAKSPDQVVGEGMIEFAGPIEDAMNAIARALINNIAIASGPMAEIDKDRVTDDMPIFPWRQIKSTSRQMKTNGPAVNYYQPQMHVQELLQAWNFFRVLLDEMTVPAYAQGASQSGVTGGTATVFTQLLAAASRSIKAVVANIDKDILVPYHRMAYDFNMKFSDDETIKGDANIVAKGVMALQAKEQQAQRKVEYLQVVANPAYMQVLGQENIGAILAQIAEANDIDLPDKDRLEGNVSAEALLMQLIQGQAGIDPIQANGQLSSGGGAPTAPQGTLDSGAKAGVNNG